MTPAQILILTREANSIHGGTDAPSSSDATPGDGADLIALASMGM